jgi:spore maturation protein CgeB
MKFLFYTHSLRSDWNHGNAHFLRGVMRELIAAGHSVVALEPQDGWSLRNLIEDQGYPAVARFEDDFPELTSVFYGPAFDHAAAVAAADVVVVHEWTDPELVARLGRERRRGDFTLLFHDTHHRAVSAEVEIAALDLADYDAILVFGETLKRRWLKAGWGHQVFTWHEAADTRLFRPRPEIERAGDLIWIGNWGDGERTDELKRFLLFPALRLGLECTVRGVRYPAQATELLRATGARYGGWIANADVPAAFAAHKVTVHVPRRPYVRKLPGIPTIRVFEALACGIPLVCAPWSDCEELFRPGVDYLTAASEQEMASQLKTVLREPALARSLAEHGLETIRARHTCRHRVAELLDILAAAGTHRVRRQLAPAEAAVA